MTLVERKMCMAASAPVRPIFQLPEAHLVLKISLIKFWIYYMSGSQLFSNL